MDDHLTPTAPTILEYFHVTAKLQSKASLLSSFLVTSFYLTSIFSNLHRKNIFSCAFFLYFSLKLGTKLVNLLGARKGDDGRHVLILDCTIFHPQGGGQPSDTGFITDVSLSRFKFVVQDVRSKNGIVYHYVVFEKIAEDLEGGVQVVLSVDESRRKLNSRLHSGGHLLDVCMQKVGLSHLEPTKGYHFPDGPYVEYKGTVPQAELQSKQTELELEANNLISKGGKVSVAVYPYEEASELCGGNLPDYIPKGSSPRIVKLGDFPGCPCGGTHVSDISELGNMKVTQMRTKKGVTKVYYNINSC